MNERIARLAYAAVSGDSFPEKIPEVCTNPEEKKDPVLTAEGFRRYLLKQTVEVRPDELIADRYRQQACEYAADYYTRSGHNHLSKFWSGICSSSHPNDLYYWGWTHVALDYGYILQNGLEGYLTRIAEAEKQFAGNEEKLRFLKGMRICLETLCERSALVAAEARRQAEDAPAAQARHLLRLAEAMEHTPRKPARDFFEAVQCVWTMFLSAPDSLGRIDQYLYPFFRAEIDAGTLKRDDAFELLEELFVKVHESQVTNRALPISGHNHLVVGGYLQNGEDGYNDLSGMILDAIADLPTFRPQASFRYTRKTSPAVMRRITELNRRCPLIVFVNDDPRIEGMVRAGIRREDAIEYTVLGCNEWAICGKSKLDLAHINLMHSFKTLLWDRREEALKAETFEDFYRLWEESLAADMRRIVEEYKPYHEAQAMDVNVLTSALTDDCIEKARSFTDMGARYYGLTLSFNGLPNMADSFSVIKEYVYDKKQLTLAELLDVLDRNWEGGEALRGEILKNAHFFGNDDAYVDAIAQNMVLSIDKVRETLSSPYCNTIVCGSFVGATHPNIIFGKMLPASPDGRVKGEEMTMGISQSGGKDKNGITALLKSIACLDYSRYCGCVVSNIKMDPRMADTPEKLERLAQLFHAFLQLGGMQLQINYINNDELRKAQACPEEYEQLMVRVTGYSGYFTIFDTDLQNDIIKRTEQSNV